jgi:hypothetical protein
MPVDPYVLVAPDGCSVGRRKQGFELLERPVLAPENILIEGVQTKHRIADGVGDP